MSSLFWPTINLAILVGILYRYLREPVKQTLSQRHTSLRDELQAVREQLASAQAKFAEFTAKLKAIDVELAALREQTRQDAETYRARIVNEAKQIAGTIITDAKASAQVLASDFRDQLRSELGARVIDRAEQMLRERLTTEDRARIRSEFSTQVEKML